jgi:hypothetical protein
MIQNIFIAHTPFHIFIAEMIVKNIFRRSKYENVIFLELSRDYQNVNCDIWSKIAYLENVGSSTLGRKRYLMSEKNIDIIKLYTDKDMETHLFMSDIAWPMNNRIFFDEHLRCSVKYCLFPDGLGTYASPKVTKALFIRGFAKSVNGLLHRGVGYKNYLGDQMGLDRKEIEYIYAPNAKLIDCDPSKKKEVSFDTIHGAVKFNKEKCLFLDQPYWFHMQDSNWQKITEMAVKSIKLLGIKELYYKNHHFGRKAEEIYFKSQGFNIINSNKCAEQIVAENDFGIVVSYVSSALFNLKCMYHDKLRCISLFSKEMSLANGYNDNTSGKVIDLFNMVNVEIIEI